MCRTVRLRNTLMSMEHIEKRPGGTRFFKRLALVLGALTAALILFLALGLATILLRPDLAKPLLQRGLSAAGVEARMGRLGLSLAPPRVIIDQAELSMGDAGHLALDHISAKLNLIDLIWGRPWIEQVSARGLNLSIPPSGTQESHGLDISPLGWIFLAQRAELHKARLSLPLLTGRLEIKNLDLALQPAQAGGRRVRLDLRAEFHDAQDRVRAEGDLSTQGQISPDLKLNGHMELKQGRAAWAGTHIPLNAKAEFDLDREQLSLSAVHLGVGRLAKAQGQVQMKFKEGVDGRLTGRIMELKKALSLVPDDLVQDLADVGIKGDVPFSLDLIGGRESSHVALALDLDKIQLTRQGLTARLGGEVRLAGGPQKPWIWGGVLIAQGSYATGSFAARNFQARLPLSGDLQNPRCSGLEISLSADALLYQGRPLALGQVRISADAAMDKGGPHLERVKLTAAGLGRLEGEARLVGDRPQVELRGKELNFAGLADLLKSAGLPLGDLTAQAPLDLVIQLKPEIGASRLLARLGFKGLSFSAENGQIMGQNLAARLAGDLLLTEQPRLQAELHLPRGETLWGTVFLNFSQNPVELKAKGVMAGPGRWRGIDLNGRLGSFGRLAAQGQLLYEKGVFTGQGKLDVAQAALGPIFATFVRDPLSASRPDLASLGPTGQAHLNLRINRTSARTHLRGRLRLMGGGLAQGKETLLQGLDVELPIAYILGGHPPKPPRPPAADHWGRLRLKRLGLGGMNLGPFDLPISLLPNRLYLGQGLDIPLWGGRVQLADIKVDEPLSPLFQARLQARLSGLDLERASTDAIKLKGSLRGRLAPVVLSQQSLKAQGALNGDMFGGSLKITHINLERPFTPGREIGADLDMKKVNLGQLSQALDIGSITGAVDVSVKGLRLAYGQPVAFDLRVESVKEADVEQKVSLKAVNSISILGTGSGIGGFGVDMLKYFFQEFPYEKIGFQCTLRNDVFRIKGLIKDDGEEYIVKKPLFTGINVINRSGDNQISFSDMLKRLKRVTAKETKH